MSLFHINELNESVIFNVKMVLFVCGVNLLLLTPLSDEYTKNMFKYY